MLNYKVLFSVLLVGVVGLCFYNDKKAITNPSIPQAARETIQIKKQNLMKPEEVVKLYPLNKRAADTPRIFSLCYHEVLDDPKDIYAIPPLVFRTHLQELKAAGYSFIDVDDLRAFVESNKPLPKNPVLISFDDGYLNNYTLAYPILKAEGAKATFFIVAASMGGKNRMTWSQMREMRVNGMQFGCHTMNHEPLDKMTEAQLKTELLEAKELIEKKLGGNICSIAYPCGYASPEVIKETRKYYKLGFLANVDNAREETLFTYNRFGVYKWNKHICSIFTQKQPKIK